MGTRLHPSRESGSGPLLVRVLWAEGLQRAQSLSRGPREALHPWWCRGVTWPQSSLNRHRKPGCLLAPGRPAEGPHSTAADTRPRRPLKAGSGPPSGVADTGPSKGQILRPSDGPAPAEPRGPAVSLLLKTRKAQLRMRFENGDVGWALLGLVCDLFAGVVGGISAEGTPCVWSLPDTVLSSKCAAGCRGPTKQGAQAGVRPEHPGTKRTKSTPERPGKAWTLHPQTQRKPEGH